jgi:hypothetical protein
VYDVESLVKVVMLLAHMDSGADAVWIQGHAVMLIQDSGHDSWQV